MKSLLFISLHLMSKQDLCSAECHWMTFTMERQPNYNLARMYCVALVTGEFMTSLTRWVIDVNPVCYDQFLTINSSLVCVCVCRQGGKTGAVQKCTACRGRGMRIMIRQLAPGMVQQMQSVCTDCNGEGRRHNDPNCDPAFPLCQLTGSLILFS